VEHPLFPAFFLNGKVALVAYFLPMFACICLWRPSVIGRQVAALAVVVGSGTLLLHVEGYNDATFTTGLWVGLWLLWWAGCAETASVPSRDQAIFFGKAIVGLFFLVGTVGKLTSGYWDGTALYQIYFVQKGTPIFSFLRETFSEATLQTMAVYFSRATVIMEGMLATVLFWPLRWAAMAIMIMIAGMVVVSHVQLISVVGPLFVLMVGLLRLGSMSSSSSPSIAAA